MFKSLRLTVVVLSALAVVGLVVRAAVVPWDGELGQFLTLAALGGVMIAVLLLGTRSLRSARIVMPDPFARDAFSLDPVNYAHVRVAGLGGAGLVLAALLMALQFPLTTAAVAAGLVGGMAVAIALIMHRRGPRSAR